MSIKILFLLTVVALPVLGYLFLQWLGGKKPSPTIQSGETSETPHLDDPAESDEPRNSE